MYRNAFQRIADEETPYMEEGDDPLPAFGKALYANPILCHEVLWERVWVE